MSQYVYDNGIAKARVIGITKPTEEFLRTDGIGSAKDLIAYCARVSNPANQHNTETAEGLLQYLIRNKHWSPFEMVNVLLEIELPRDIGRQLLRHRFGFQEFSQRYAQATKFVLREARLQDSKNRQASILTTDDDLQNGWREQQQRVLDAATAAYQWALDRGVAKECASVVLPEGLTMSTMYINGNIRSWIHYLELRLANGTQMEHRALAYCIGHAITATFGDMPLSSIDVQDPVHERIAEMDE